MRIILTLALLLATFSSAWADTMVDNLVVRRAASNVNIRVTIRNPGQLPQDGPVVIHLFARPQGEQEWTLLQTWSDIKSMDAGDELARDYFDVKSESLTEIAGDGRFQVKAVVEAPGVTRTIEKSSGYTTLREL